MDNWNPLKEAYEDKSFNSYDSGVGKKIQEREWGSAKGITLFVGSLPAEISNDGLRNLFLKAGNVLKAHIVQGKDGSSNIGFVTMERAVEAESAIREFHRFEIGQNKLDVKVARSKEEKERHQQKRSYMPSVEDFEDSSSDVDMKPAKTTSTANKENQPTSMIGKGRGAILNQIVTGSGDASFSAMNGQCSPRPLTDLTVRVEHRGSGSVNGSGLTQTTAQVSPATVGRGQSAPGRQAPAPGSYQPAPVAYQSDTSNRGRGTPRGRVRGRGREGPPRGRGRGRGYWNDHGFYDNNIDYNSGYHGGDGGYYEDWHSGPRGRGYYGNQGRGRGYYPPPDRSYADEYYGPYPHHPDPRMLGRGMQFPAYVTAAPTYYVDPSYMPVLAAPNTHLLQPAYATTPAINPGLVTPSIHSASLAQKDVPMPKQECSVCNKLGSYRCSRCKTPYCSSECQQFDWTNHKGKCGAVQKENEEKAMDAFDVTFGEGLIPQVQSLIEKVTGDKIEITRKSSKDINNTRLNAETSPKSGKLDQAVSKKPDRSPSNGQPSPRVNIEQSRVKDNVSDSRSIKESSSYDDDRRQQSSARSQIGSENSRAGIEQSRAKDKVSDSSSMKESSSYDVDRKQQSSARDLTASEKSGSLRSGSPKRRDNTGSGRPQRPTEKGSFRYGDGGHMKNESRSGPASDQGCFNCGDTSHRKSDCPKPHGCCNLCGDTTHKRINCPKKNDQKDNREPLAKSADMTQTVSRDTKVGNTSSTSPPGMASSTSKRGSLPPKKHLSMLSLPFNEPVKVVITEFENPGSIWVQLVSDQTLRDMSTLTKGLNMNADSACDVNSVMVGEMYAGRFSQDMMWYRVQVQKVHGDQFSVHFVDFGNCEITSTSQLRQLSPDLLQFAAQAIHCSLQGIVAPDGSWKRPSSLYQALVPANREYTAVCSLVSDAKVHSVVMTTAEGADVSGMLVSEGLALMSGRSDAASKSKDASFGDGECLMTRDFQRHKLKLNDEELFLITPSEDASPLKFACQVITKDLVAYNEKLQQIYHNSNCKEYRPKQVGELVMARFPGDEADEGWYRADVLELKHDNCKVLYLDYLNTSHVKFSMVRQAVMFCLEMPALGVWCRLHSVAGAVTDEANVLFLELAASPLKGKVVSVERDAVLLDMFTIDKGEWVNQLVNTLITKSKSPRSSGSLKGTANGEPKKGCPVSVIGAVKSVIKSRQFMPGDELVPMLVTHIGALDAIYIQLQGDDLEAFAQVFLELNQGCESESVYFPKVSEYVAAKFEADGTWYRGFVEKKLDTKKFAVRFVDYGNTGIVDVSNIRKLKPEHCELPELAVCCQLMGSEGSKDQQVLCDLQELMVDKQVMVKFVSSANGIYSILMFLPDGVTCVNTIMNFLPAMEEISTETNGAASSKSEIVTKVHHAEVSTETGAENSTGIDAVASSAGQANGVKAPKAVVLLKESELPLDGSQIKIQVTHIEALDEIYVQKLDQVMEAFAHMQSQLNLVCESESVYEPKELEYVAAKFDDGTWYRGVAEKKVDETKFCVHFVDYGNTGVVELGNLRQLRSNFTELPLMAVRCQLKGSEGLVDPEVLSVMQSTMVFQPYIAKALKKDNGVYSIVMYLMDGETCINEGFGFAQQTTWTDVSEKRETENEASPQSGQLIGDIDGISDRLFPSDGNVIKASVVHIDNLASFFVQIADEATERELVNVTKELNEACHANEEIYKGKVGDIVAAMYTCEGVTLWYRARIIDFRTDAKGVQYRVCFLDYGNEDWVLANYIRTLSEEFRKVPKIAMRCKLARSTGVEDEAKVADFQSVKTSIVEVQVLEKQADRYLVDLMLIDQIGTKYSVSKLMFGESEVTSLGGDNGETAIVREPVTPFTVKTPEKGAIPKNDVSAVTKTDSRSASRAANRSPRIHITIQSMSLKIGETVAAAIVWIESVRSFFVQLADEETQQEFGKMMNLLIETCDRSTVAYQPEVGEYVGVYYFDGQHSSWYRAEVVELIGHDKVKVLFVDYGNVDVVAAKDVRKLERKVLALGSMAIHCGLIGEGDESGEMMETLKEFLMIELKVCAFSCSDGKYNVEMISLEGVNVGEKIGLRVAAASDKHSTQIVDQLPKANTLTASYDSLPRKVASPPKGERKAFFTQTLNKNRPQCRELWVVITSIVRPNLFHCQEFTEDQERLKELTYLSEQMKLECEHIITDGNHSVTGDNRTFEVGELCCARFPVEGGAWYRATVLEVFPDKTVKVEYIDFGNIADVPVSQLCPATEEYTHLPVQAFSCTLHGVIPVGKTWSKQAMLEMTKFQDKPLKAKVVARDNDVYDLEISDADGNDLAEVLKAAGLAASVEDSSGLSEVERMRRENEILKQQLELAQKQMASLKKHT